MTMTSDQAGDR